MKEYYYASYLLSNNKLLEEFLNEKSGLHEYEEIFMILVGLTKEIPRQKYILDSLLEKNFSLFVKCLHRRFNFSDEFEKNKSKSFYEEFLKRLQRIIIRLLIYIFRISEDFSPHFVGWTIIRKMQEFILTVALM